jgi:hypothetical protein
MTKNSERRRWPRGLHESPITTKILSSTSPALSPGHTFESSSLDISSRGLCLRVNTPVHVGTELEMWIISSRHKDTLVLGGAVRWCLPIKGDPSLYQIGVELLQKPVADFVRWQKVAKDLVA